MNKYLKPQNYLNAARILANESILPLAELTLSRDPSLPLKHPPIFILGAPRCGSTLAVQVITKALTVGFLSNRHAQWYGAPALCERMFPTTPRTLASDYRSKHGNINGTDAPSEAGEWWYRFFRRSPVYTPLQESFPKKMRSFRRSITALTNAFDRPILFKNLYASLRLQPITSHIPESIFIVVHRNEIDNAHSILEARYKQFGSYDHWFSSEPPNIDSLKKLPPEQQAIEQVREIHKTINQDLATNEHGVTRRFDIHYEELCNDTHKCIKQLKSFLRKHNPSIEDRDVVPFCFKRRSEIKIPNLLYKKVVEYSTGSNQI